MLPDGFLRAADDVGQRRDSPGEHGQDGRVRHRRGDRRDAQPRTGARRRYPSPAVRCSGRDAFPTRRPHLLLFPLPPGAWSVLESVAVEQETRGPRRQSPRRGLLRHSAIPHHCFEKSGKADRFKMSRRQGTGSPLSLSKVFCPAIPRVVHPVVPGAGNKHAARRWDASGFACPAISGRHLRVQRPGREK